MECQHNCRSTSFGFQPKFQFQWGSWRSLFSLKQMYLCFNCNCTISTDDKEQPNNSSQSWKILQPTFRQWKFLIFQFIIIPCNISYYKNDSYHNEFLVLQEPFFIFLNHFCIDNHKKGQGTSKCRTLNIGHDKKNLKTFMYWFCVVNLNTIWVIIKCKAILHIIISRLCTACSQGKGGHFSSFLGHETKKEDMPWE